MVGDALGWEAVEVYDGLTEPGAAWGSLSRAVLSRPALAERLKSFALPLVPWGRAPGFAELAGEALPPDALRYESKRAAHELFTLLAPAHPGIRVPEHRQAATRRAAARPLRTRGRAGQTTGVKTEHGAGGSGTWVIRKYRFPSQLPHGPLLLEEFVAGEAGEAGETDVPDTVSRCLPRSAPGSSDAEAATPTPPGPPPPPQADRTRARTTAVAPSGTCLNIGARNTPLP
ncbi:hypothetical protein GCM10017771_21050 [Streptomyces capitiformicae]|uniref:Uncharacterized protein n=2 Tax=Streptomyces capitiformicae TaxID=2014920 RepID=A0A919L7V9_9ACTN|nr:hypothetical protein GCM10017771_21050 [Streptomyces capitiformicae]